MHAWVAKLELRDANGQLAKVTPHRFRHTLATRMINAGVPEIAVQQMLDHNSPHMTSVYARLHDQTLREHFDRFQQRVDIRGQAVRTPGERGSPTPRGPRRTSPAPSRRSPTATAACRSSRAARTRTPA
jgi:hypothetical protein